MAKVGFCYQCDQQVSINDDLTCSQCGTDFVELQENQTQVINNNIPSFFRSLFQGIQRNAPRIQTIFQTITTASEFLNQASSSFDSPDDFQATINLIARIFPQFSHINSILNDQNVARVFQHLHHLNELFHQHPPADQNTIHNLDPQRYTDGICIDNTCAICLDNMNENEEVIVLPCRHGYHRNCIETWLNAHNVCPTCRQSI